LLLAERVSLLLLLVSFRVSIWPALLFLFNLILQSCSKKRSR
jgi:hypothetical protein